MSRRVLGVVMATLVTLAVAAPAQAGERLNSYKVKVKSGKTIEQLALQGFDVTEGGKGRRIEIVATSTQARKLAQQGVRARLSRARGGKTALRAHISAVEPWKVWRPYARTDVPVTESAGNPADNLMTQLEKLARKYPQLADLQTIGHSVTGLPIYAMRVTKNPRQHKDGSRPAVLYTSLQHAREWLAAETNRRQLRLFLDNYGRTGPAIGVDGQPVAGITADEITNLVNTRELWFVLVCNPDGYDYTFTPENRLWRKNLRDNNGDGQITSIDGVDPNRNYPTHWGYDNEGSSDDPSSETFRGAGPASEPETQAIESLTKRVHFAWNKNDHTWGRLLLYPFGWQVDTHAADEPIFRRIAGVDGAPPDSAIPGFHSKVGADLYTTNGDTNDHLYHAYKSISMTPEGAPGVGTGSGFIFQDVEADVQAEFERHVKYSVDLARSAKDPSRPASWQGNPLPDMEAHTFPLSFGSPQTVEVNARRDLGKIVVKYQIDGGATRSLSTTEWQGGERYGDEGDYWYHRMRAQITGAHPGDDVKVWFEAPATGAKTAPFTYHQRSDSGDKVLVLAAEDYTGTSALPAYPSANGPFFAQYYTDALAANGIASDVYDIDAEGRTAPDPLGVLSHYKAVVWETGNDNVTRDFNRGGVSGRLPHDTQIAVRDFMNEGGRLLYTGVNAGREYTLAEYPGFGNPPTDCDGVVNQNFEEPCKPLSNDFLQYWLGSYVRSDAGGLDDDGNAWPLTGLDDPFGGWSATLNGPDSAGNNVASAGVETGTHLVTSSILKPDRFPQFESWQVADWQIPTDKPFDPHSGDWYMYSQDTNQAFKRLTKTIDLTGQTSGALSFFASYNVEQDWDYVFVEAHTVGQDDWTTLPDANGHTGTDTGQSCPASSDWFALHPFMRHYQTRTGTDSQTWTCAGGGTTGAWNAATGNSGGWQEWNVDLSAFAGTQVEVSITYITDWATLPSPGLLVDDVTVRRGATTEATSFEDGLGGWTVSGPPAGSTNANDWTRSQKIFEDAAVVATDDSLYFGFGFEGITGAEARRDTMDRAMQYLLR